MAVPVTSNKAALDVGTAVPLFKARMLLGPTTALGLRQQYDVTPDGKGFLINVPIEDATASSVITVVLNSPAALITVFAPLDFVFSHESIPVGDVAAITTAGVSVMIGGILVGARE